MKRFLLVLLTVVLFSLICQGREQKEELEEQQQTEKERETVLQANHFSSETQTKASYDLTEVERQKSLLFILKPHETESTDLTLENNPITITLKDGQTEKSCLFNSYTQLCVLPQITSEAASVTVECQKTPCELSWLILQPPVLDQDGKHQIQNLVSINKDKNHASVRVSCDNPELADKFGQEIELYTNSKYEKVVGERIGLVYFLFDNENQGYYFLTTANEKVKECANVSLLHMNDNIVFNDEKELFMDFLEPDKENVYQFKSIPNSDFRIQAHVFDIAFKDLTNQTGIRIYLHGYKDKQKETLSSMELNVDNQKTSIQFNIIYKKPTQKYTKMELQIFVYGQILMFEGRFISGDVQEVELGELSFFELKKGQQIHYKLVPLDKELQGIDKVHIFPSSGEFKVSQQTCPITGCEFTVEALQPGQGNIYLGEGEKRNITESIVLQFQKSVTSKIGPGQQLDYAHKIKMNEAIQLVINVPSVVVYAASKTKCPEIDIQKCYQVSFNHHLPAFYEPKEEGPLLFKVVGLDNCQFTLTVLDKKSPFIEIHDTQPFSYLFDNKESSLIFEFNMEKKEDVSFNLIGPLNELNLYVLNENAPAKNNKLDWSTAQLSSDGFIKYSQAEIKGLSFAIKVEKRTQYKDKYIHFTLIASTKEANLRLEGGSPHYQTLKPKDTRDYVFQFVPSSKIYLNLYTHNIKTNINYLLKLSNADEYKDPENTAEFVINKHIDILDVGLASQKLCKMNQGENCQLFVRLENKMSVEADVTLTLVIENSIIQLKDGIWQSYAINAATTSSHFYFLPKHQNHSATIFYKPSVVDLRILYNVWKSDDLSISTAEWPFPLALEEPGKRFEFKPLQYIHIQPLKLKQCWPNCVILISMISDSAAFQQEVDKNQSNLQAHFRIMASNNYIQLPQKHKIDILLTKNQSKQLLVDLKYFLEKEQLSFYTHFTIGKAKIKANVYSQSNPRCPTPDDAADFDFDPIETNIVMDEVKKKMGENSMQGDKNVYLCILAQADQNTKFNIEFNSNGQGYKKLMIDTVATLKTSNKESLYYIDNSQEVSLKITRDQGFPYYSTKLCKGEDDLTKCFDSFAQNKDEGPQLANKVTTISQKPCPKCILLIKLTAKEETELTLHAQSKFTQLQLTANNVVSDSLTTNSQNRYTLTGTRDEQIILNIQIISGNLKVGVHDFQKVDIVKTNAKGSKNIHITIPPKDLTPNQKEMGTTHMSSFGLSSFIHLHITVQSEDNKPASYSITYSSGSPVVYLQDGLITQYNLISKKQTKFIYKNPTSSPIYLYTSTTDAETLKKLKLKYYALDNLEDEDTSTQLTPEKADFQKKTINPTHLAHLPAKKAYFFSVTNENDKSTIFTIGVNNREIVYLPFDHEFPIELGPTELIYLVLKVGVEGYVKVTFSKCSISYPYLSYTMDYDEFIKEDYSIEDQMSQELVSEIILKVKSSSGLYIKVRSSDTDKTIMSIKATFSAQKIKPTRAKPGDKGLIQYQLLDSTKAELTFSTLVCNSEKNCNKDFIYTSVSSDKLQNIYAQLVCPSIMFSLPDIQQLKSAILTPISTTGSNGNKITFTQNISKDIEYVGVKATNSKSGEVVYYQPVEIVTFWGQLHRSSQTTIIFACFIVLIFGCGCLMVYRRYKPSGYQPLGELNDNLS